MKPTWTAHSDRIRDEHRARQRREDVVLASIILGGLVVAAAMLYLLAYAAGVA